MHAQPTLSHLVCQISSDSYRCSLSSSLPFSWLVIQPLFILPSPPSLPVPTMTEADFEREAIKLFRQLGLTVDAETLDFFQGESVSLTDWRSSFKSRPLKPLNLLYSKPYSRMSTSSTSSCSTSPHHRKRVPLMIARPSSDIGSEGSISASPTESTEEDEEFGE